MKAFPFLTASQAITVLRIITGLIFVSHAVVRISNSTVDRFGGFLNSKGFVWGVLMVWILTVYEIAGGLLLTIGVFTRWLALGFMVIICTGIVIIHAANGWFVGEHGTGGTEYSVLLLAALVVVAASDKKKTKD